MNDTLDPQRVFRLALLLRIFIEYSARLQRAYAICRVMIFILGKLIMLWGDQLTCQTLPTDFGWQCARMMTIFGLAVLRALRGTGKQQLSTRLKIGHNSVFRRGKHEKSVCYGKVFTFVVLLTTTRMCLLRDNRPFYVTIRRTGESMT